MNKADDDHPDDLGDDLYREHILDHYQNPRNAGRLEPADINHDGDNPTCGDVVRVTARVKDGKLGEIKFQGQGCAISQASASIVYEDLAGKPLESVLELNYERVQELLGLKLRPARVKCATLGLVALKEGIKEYKAKAQPGAKAPPGFGRRAPT